MLTCAIFVLRAATTDVVPQGRGALCQGPLGSHPDAEKDGGWCWLSTLTILRRVIALHWQSRIFCQGSSYG
eukprot:4129114-Amphidinium_carterae.1